MKKIVRTMLVLGVVCLMGVGVMELCGSSEEESTPIGKRVKFPSSGGDEGNLFVFEGKDFEGPLTSSFFTRWVWRHTPPFETAIGRLAEQLNSKKPPVGFNCSNTAVKREALERIVAEFENVKNATLEKIILDNCENVDDNCLLALPKNIKNLSLRGDKKILGNTLNHFSWLETLDLIGTGLRSENLIGFFSPGLQTLSVSNFKAEDFQYLKELPDVTQLHIVMSDLSKKNMSLFVTSVKRPRVVQKLNLRRCEIDNLNGVKNFKNLVELDLSENWNLDAGELKKLPKKLKILRLRYCSKMGLLDILNALKDFNDLALLDCSGIAELDVDMAKQAQNKVKDFYKKSYSYKRYKTPELILTDANLKMINPEKIFEEVKKEEILEKENVERK